jgi:spore germination protein YaaH
MTIENKGNTTIIKDFNANLPSLITNINIQIDELIKKNTIIDISNYRYLTIKDFNTSFSIARNYKKAKKSLVLVVSDFDFDKVSDKINLVPTLQEAHDIIEMEEIERDLGF